MMVTAILVTAILAVSATLTAFCMIRENLRLKREIRAVRKNLGRLAEAVKADDAAVKAGGKLQEILKEEKDAKTFEADRRRISSRLDGLF